MSGYEFIKTADGSQTLVSDEFGELYHSRHGAIQESQHVFIKNGLCKSLMSGREEVSILEIGFGTGLNAFLSMLQAESLQIDIKYTTYENYPLPQSVFSRLQYAGLLGVGDSHNLFLDLHTAEWNQSCQIHPRFILEKRQRTFDDIQDTQTYDLIYMDAFAPSVQSQFWENPFIMKLFNSLKPGGMLSTYCAKGSFKRALKEAGFVVIAEPGPIGKREMTTAFRPETK